MEAETSRNEVGINDIYSVLRRDYPNSKSSIEESFTITPYTRGSADTLMFIVNSLNEEGWKIYSSDKRTPAILAEGPNGCFSLKDGSPAVAIWLECLADDMAKVKSSTDDKLTFSKDDIHNNMAFWSNTRSLIIDPPLLDLYPPGHWEEEIFSQIEYCDVVDHLVGKWDQWGPYNACCPFYVHLEGTRAVTGCTALAGAQVLHYLHYKLGIPQMMYSQGYCNGDVNNFTKHFSNPTANIWDSMRFEYRTPGSSQDIIPEAVLISYVGQCVNMHYVETQNNQYSWAVPQNLKPDLFEYHGISCKHDTYNEDDVIRNLSQNIPVIVSASHLLVPLDGDIHTFVIDGYRKKRTKYIHHHYYVVDDPSSGPYILPDDYSTYSYSAASISEIKINWGWWSQWYRGQDGEEVLNDGWYTLTGSWTVHDTEGEESSYNRYRKMIYDFAVAQ